MKRKDMQNRSCETPEICNCNKGGGDGEPWPWDVYKTELHLPGGNVQYPLRDEWGMRWQKSILSATTSKFKALEPKRELCAFPLMNNLWNLGRYTQSTTKLLQCTPSLAQEFQKKDDFHKGTIKVPLARHNTTIQYNTLFKVGNMLS